jgi:FixJ family two-component response regulator
MSDTRHNSILVYEDDADMLENIKSIVDDEIVLANPDDILEALNNNNFNAAIIDVDVNSTKSLEVFKSIRNKYPYLPVVVLGTDIFDTRFLEEVPRFITFIRKPFANTALSSFVEKALEVSNLYRANEFLSLAVDLWKRMLVITSKTTRKILFANKEAAKVAGVNSVDELIDKHISEFITDVSLQKLDYIRLELLENGTASTDIELRNGKQLLIDMNTINGYIITIGTIYTPIEKNLRLLEQAAEQAQMCKL